MKIIGFFDNTGLDTTFRGPDYKQVVVEIDGNIGIQYYNQENASVHFYEVVEFMKDNAQVEEEINAYLEGKESTYKSRYIPPFTYNGQNQETASKFKLSIYPREGIEQTKSFMPIEKTEVHMEEGYELSEEEAPLAIVVAPNVYYIGSPQFILETISVLFPDSKELPVLRLKIAILESCECYEEVVSVYEEILAECTLDEHDKEFYTRYLEIARRIAYAQKRLQEKQEVAKLQKKSNP